MPQPGSVVLDFPPNATIRITAITNSGEWTQEIVLSTPDGSPLAAWTGTGGQSNKVVGQLTIPKSAAAAQIKVGMSYSSGSDGPQPSTILSAPFSFQGLSGFVVGGQDGGGRPNGPAFWNTMVFIYYAVGY
jgi:hypothetical protein